MVIVLIDVGNGFVCFVSCSVIGGIMIYVSGFVISVFCWFKF